jgi:hypothetical protein
MQIRHTTTWTLIAWATPPALFCDGVFKIGSLELFAWSWHWNPILLISASCVARITGVSHQCQAQPLCFDRGVILTMN